MRLRSTVLAVVVLGMLQSSAPPGVAASPVELDVIVQATGDRAAAAAAVRAVGGRVTDDLPIVDGVAARIPGQSRARLERTAGVLAVTLNAAVRPADHGGPDDGSAEDFFHGEADGTGASGTGGGNEGSTASSPQPGQPAVLATRVGALHARGLTGAHDGSAPTRVVLLDTGVDLETATSGDLQGRVLGVKDPFAPTAEQARDVACVNLSNERGCDDNYGHGTFVAGVIAGSGRASGGTYAGAAPGADLISVKVAGRSGVTDVRRILKGLEWVVSFRDRYDIGVLNLSLGAVGTTDPALDPVNRAVQRVWDAGIVVVAAAGNQGEAIDPSTSTITKPGNAPLVLTVGATDDQGTYDVADDVAAAYTGRGAPGEHKPDVVAPGSHVVSLRAVGSTTDTLGTLVDGTYRRGSGTSMSAGIVSGVVALMRQAHPALTPDQVKAALRATARSVGGGTSSSVGRGLVDATAALNVSPSNHRQLRPVGTVQATAGADELSWWAGSDWAGSDWAGSDAVRTSTR